MKRFLILSLCVSFLAACKGGSKETPSGQNPKTAKPNSINIELEHALNKVLDPSQARSESAPCPGIILNGLSEELQKTYECGALRVPFFHEKPGREFMSVAYLKITKDRSVKKPLLVIEQGGPGGSSMMVANYYVRVLPDLMNNFDILAVEQRGTLWTRPEAFCNGTIDVFFANALSGQEDNTAIENAVKKCATEIQTRFDLSAISSYQIASDIDSAAKHFGHKNYSFYGVSYGTVVGQYLLKFYPESLEKTVLDSPVVLGNDWTGDAMKNMDPLFKKNLQNFIALTFDGEFWNKNYDETIAYFQELNARIGAQPIEVSVSHDGKTHSARFNSETFVGLLVQVFVIGYNPGHAYQMLAALESRDADTLGSFLEYYMDPQEDVTNVMYQSIICREFEIEDSEAFQIMSRWTEFRKVIGRDFDQMAKDASRTRCYLGFKKRTDSLVLTGPIATDESVLVVGGELDHVTNPSYVNDVSVHFSRGQQLVFKGVGHGVLTEKECIGPTIIGYLTDKNGNFKNQCE